MKKYPFPIFALLCGMMQSGCMQPPRLPPQVPAVEYARAINQARSPGRIYRQDDQVVTPTTKEIVGSAPAGTSVTAIGRAVGTFEVPSREEPRAQLNADTAGYVPASMTAQDYNGPLSLGDPGLSASLWRESNGSPDFFRDVRAWQPMDLITIIIDENSEGKKEADTELKSQSSILASIESLLGFEDDVTSSNPNVELASLLQATTKNDFKGEGETNRKDELTGTISAMVAEVLPSGILRIEGRKIIAVNNEEQVMVISGLARPRDIKSDNTVDSSRLANMRIDYFGTGQVGNLQREGWLSTVVRKVWPF
jgi:flagellar L-ring protein precursor FlgH